MIMETSLEHEDVLQPRLGTEKQTAQTRRQTRLSSKLLSKKQGGIAIVRAWSGERGAGMTDQFQEYFEVRFIKDLLPRMWIPMTVEITILNNSCIFF